MGKDLSDDIKRLESAIKGLGNPAGEVDVSRKLKEILDAVELCCSNAADNFGLVHDELDVLTGKVDENRTELDLISDSVSSLSSAVDANSTTLQSIDDKLEAVESDLDDIDGAVDSLDTTVKDIGEGGESASGLLSKVQDMLNTLRS
jgi:ABC-type transporter Mla subunit MlaD